MNRMFTPLSPRHRQSGAAAVEFAFVFPFLFLLMYGVVVYAYLFVIHQSMSYAAQEAAEAAVAVSPAASNPDSLRATRIRSTATAVLSWMPAAQRQRVVGTAGERVQIQYCVGGSGGLCPSGTDAVIVTLTFNPNSPALFPVVQMPLLGAIPPMPAQLTARAVARI